MFCAGHRVKRCRHASGTLRLLVMADRLHIAIAQINPAAGAIAANADAVLAARARAPAADILLAPGLVLDGGPLADLAASPAFQRSLGAQLQRLAAATAGGPAIILGHSQCQDGAARPAASLLADGAIRATVVDGASCVQLGGHQLAIAAGTPATATLAGLRQAGASLLLEAGCLAFASDGPNCAEVATARANASGLATIVANRCGGLDSWAFAGGSAACHADGRLALRLADWAEDSAAIQWAAGAGLAQGRIAAADSAEAALYQAMLVGLRDYVAHNRFPGVLIGLSGGIDSALTAAIAVDALGPDKVWCILLPSRFTSSASDRDARACAASLGVRLDQVGIEPAVGAMGDMLAPLFAGTNRNLAEENIQARLRMVALMAISNKFGHLLLATGNKSEEAVGYSTIYGDGAGGFSVLADLYKTDVYRLSRWRNANRPRLGLGPDGAVIPENILTKAPTAELRENQRDADSLPPYDVLDPIIRALVEDQLTVADVVARGIADRATAIRVEQLVAGAEHKRLQAPPGIRLSRHGFIGRQYPITNAFRTADTPA